MPAKKNTGKGEGRKGKNIAKDQAAVAKIQAAKTVRNTTRKKRKFDADISDEDEAWFSFSRSTALLAAPGNLMRIKL